MFKALIARVLRLFNEKMYPELDEDEKKAFNPKYTRILQESVKFVPGGRFNKGRIIMTKTVDDEFDRFFEQLIDTLRFPGMLSIDAHGFAQTKEGAPVFLFGSVNSSIKLWNGEQSVFIQR